MDEQKPRLIREPGRRYAAARVRPRAGADVVSRSPAVSKQNQDIQAKPAQASPHQPRKTSTAKPALPRQHRSKVLKRHMVERAVEHRKQVRTTHRRQIFGLVSVFIVIGALLAIVWSFSDFLPSFNVSSWPIIGTAKQSDQTQLPIVRPTSALDESKPSTDDVALYQAALDAPRVLRISKLQIESRVKRVGVSLNGEPISPSNIFDVGWFDDSGKPGQGGAMLINGHISGRTKQGVFYGLEQLQPEDEIEIERGDKKILRYRVVKVQTFSGDQLDMNSTLESIDASKPGLNLVTSSANYDGGGNLGGKRVIVFAVQQ